VFYLASLSLADPDKLEDIQFCVTLHYPMHLKHKMNTEIIIDHNLIFLYLIMRKNKKELIIMDTAKTLREKFNEMIEKKKVDREKQKKNNNQREDKPKIK
jgi:hypothetical protein